ncbi:hypothetical protein L596_030300 [Steinernema carpocapsae]|uniref:Secreted protein n=1 Tax=Steinernema carpocapsae TaxID=34508 RepID=A0A4U5LNZ1_STECR|nr:hypothetical protein L596_030300 [Steinernema carpocapsae]
MRRLGRALRQTRVFLALTLPLKPVAIDRAVACCRVSCVDVVCRSSSYKKRFLPLFTNNLVNFRARNKICQPLVVGCYCRVGLTFSRDRPKPPSVNVCVST